MLSICIPIYNTSIKKLVESIYRQCLNANIAFEIICLDDYSTLYLEENKIVNSHKEIQYSFLDKNVGRAVVRNLLAVKANFPYLLFLDSDVSIPDLDFIKKYIECIKKEVPVVIGGISYNKNLLDKTKKLHHTYGNQRESRSVEARSQNPYSSFLTGNLLIQKKLVIEIQFLATLKDYGHEDTLFCLELKKRSIPINHIDNPIIHEGLETNEIFVSKQLIAVKNLSYLIQKGYNLEGISLYDYSRILKKYKLAFIFYLLFKPLSRIIENALKSGKTNKLFLFDALRLYTLLDFLKAKK